MTETQIEQELRDIKTILAYLIRRDKDISLAETLLLQTVAERLGLDKINV